MRILFFCLALITLGCTSFKKKGQSTRQTEYAKHFDLVERNGYELLRIYSPEDGALESEYALVKKGARIRTKLPQISVPIEGIAALSSTHVGMLSVLGEEQRIKVTTDKQYISNKYVLSQIEKGKVQALQNEQQLSPKRLLDRGVKIIMYSGFGRAYPKENEMKTLGIYPMANYDWREIHPLGKAEWVKVFGALTGKQTEAEIYFKQVKKAYALAKKAIVKSKKPSVISGSLVGSVWYAPAGESYMARLFKDAGIDYKYKQTEGTGSTELTLTQVFKDQQEIDFWINPGAATMKELEQEQQRYSLFTAFKKKQVYCYTHRSNYFWEMGAVHPDWILQDLATITGTVKHPYLIHFYKKLK